MAATVTPLRKCTAGGSNATIRAEFKQLLLDAGLVMVDDYTNFITVKEDFGGTYATPVYLNLSVPGNSVNAYVEGVYLGWNATTHVGVNRLSAPGSSFSGFFYGTNVTYCWGSNYTSWLQAFVGSALKVLTMHLSGSANVAQPNLTTSANWQQVRWWAASNPPSGWPSDTPYLIVEGMSAGTSSIASQFSAQNNNSIIVAMTHPSPVITQYSSGHRAQAPAFMLSATTVTLPGGGAALLSGRAFMAWDGVVYRGASEITVIPAVVNAFNIQNPAGGDRLVITPGVEEYMPLYWSNGPTNAPSAIAEFIRTV